MQRRAFQRRLLHRNAQAVVHPGLEQRTQIMQAADGQRPGDAVEDGGLQPAVVAQHARNEMPACGMAGEPDRSRDERGRLGDRYGDFRRNVGDARGRRQRVAWQCHRPAVMPRAFGEISPRRFVEAHPIAAVDEDDEALAVAVGQDQVEALALAGAIGDVGAKFLQSGAISRRALRPQRRYLVRARDMGRIGVSVIPIAHRDFLDGLKTLWTWRQSATGAGGVLVFSLSLKDFGTPVDWAAPVIARAATCPPKLYRRRKQSGLPPRAVRIASSQGLLAMTAEG